MTSFDDPKRCRFCARPMRQINLEAAERRVLTELLAELRDREPVVGEPTVTPLDDEAAS